MGETPATTEDHSLRGPIDRPALITIRDLVDEAEPLATPQLDDFLNPSVLEVSLDNGLCGATSARIDVQWTTQADYKFHYTDSKDVNFRWGSILTMATTFRSLISNTTIHRLMLFLILTMLKTPALNSLLKN